MLARVDELREPVALDIHLSLRPARTLNHYNHLRPVKGLARRTDPPPGRRSGPGSAAQDFCEIAGRSGRRRRYHCHPQRAPGHRSVPSMQRQSFALGQQGPAGPRHRRSLPPRQKILIIALPLAFVLLIAMGLAFGPPGPSSSPTTRAPASGPGPAAGIAAPATGAALVH